MSNTFGLPPFALLLGLVCTLAILPVVDGRAQTVVDSTRMEVKVFTYAYEDGPYFQCGSGMYAIWRDIGMRIVNGPTSFSNYTLVATDGQAVYSTGETLSNPQLNIQVPAGYYGIRSGSTGTQGGIGGDFGAVCSRYESIYQTWASGGTVPPSDFRVTEWWALFGVPAGSVIAGFTWQQTRGLEIAFDGGFRLSREVEITGAKPVASYEWDFGDGKGPSSAARPTHTYDQPGSYTVSLTVTDDDGQQDTETRQVTVSGVVLEYTATATGAVEVGDTMYVSLSVTNVGTVKAVDVSIPRDYNFPPTYPESELWYSTDASRLALTTTSPLTVPELGAGETVNTGQSYKVPTGAVEQLNGVSRDVPVRWKMSVHGLSATDEEGFPATVNNAYVCEAGNGCLDETLVSYKQLSVAGKATTLDAQQGTLTMFSGIRRALDTDVYEHLIGPGAASQQCNSGCVDLELEAKSGGLPLEGATIELTRFLVDTDASGRSNVTPGQGGGFFCVGSRCGTALTLDPTDVNGLAKARFWSPGVVWPVIARITIKARKAGYETSEVELEITINPSFAPTGSDVLSFSPSYDDMVALLVAETAEVLTANPFKDLDDVCKSVAQLIIDQTVGKRYADRSRQQLLKAATYAKDQVCGAKFKTYFIDREFESETIGKTREQAAKAYNAVRQLSTIVSVLWTFKWFDLPWSGVGEFSLLTSPPYVAYTSEMWDKVLATNRELALAFAQSWQPPSKIELYLHEVSHRTSAGSMVKALHLNVRAPLVDARHLITKNYTPAKFLASDPPGTVVGSASSAGDVSLTVAGSAAQGISALRNRGGDTTTSASLARPGVAADADSIFGVGHVVLIDPDSATEEIAQILSIGGGTLALSVPLKYDHAAGAEVVYYDSVATGPPGAPSRYGGLMGVPVQSVTPELAWFSFEPAMSYSVDVATDTLFQDIVQSYTGLTETAVTLAELEPRASYFWRVAAANLAGQGPWSDWYPLRTGAPYGDNLTEAIVVADSLDFTRFAVHFGATSETGEVNASCGVGDNSLWFTYTPTESRRVAFETFDSSYDTILSVWTGGGHPLIEIACNDDHTNPGGGTLKTSFVEFDAVAATTYYVRVSGRDDAEGMLALTFRGPTAVGVDDDEPIGPVDAGRSALVVEAYPNPVYAGLNVAVEQPTSGPLRIEIYDVLGRRVAVVSDEVRSAGRHEIMFDTGAFRAGTYLLVVRSGVSSASRILVVSR